MPTVQYITTHRWARLVRNIVLTSALLAALSACKRDAPHREPAPPIPTFDKPHVILISLDTLRPDYLGFYGHPWVKTPHLDALAKEAVVLDDCSTPVPTTLASHTSLFSGLYPRRHGVPRNGYVVHDANVTMAELLGDAGYDTAGFIGSFALSSRFNIDQGFQHYDEYPDGAGFYTPKHADDIRTRERNAESVTDAVMDYLDSATIDSPLFLFAHYFDAHAPYSVPASHGDSYRTRTEAPPHRDAADAIRGRLEYLTGQSEFRDASRLIRLYAEQITYLDEHLGRLLRYFEDRSVLDNAIVVVTSDHGESLWNHAPYFDHGQAVYQDTIRTVGLIRLPGGRHGGTRITYPTSNLDLLPTILANLGIDAPPEQHGMALRFEDGDTPPALRPLFAEATKPSTVEPEGEDVWINREKARSIRLGKWKLIHTPYLNDQIELYDLETDPGERQNLTSETSLSERLTDLHDTLVEWTKSSKPRPSAYATDDETDTREALKALGYH
jgi:arylsulfatase A-like enzyme